jgi:hypothetical protein
MIKVHFLNEINLKNVVRLGSKGPEVKKVQEWINLWRFVDTEWKHIVSVDGDFGPQTDQIIRVFQQKFNLVADGVVGSATFHKLVEPMIKAFTRIDIQNYRDRIVAYAVQHLNNQPKELYNTNQGPWVRAYMDGNEGRDWAWCMGFVQTVLDQAFTGTTQTFTIVMPHTYSCDVVGFFGREKRKLIDHESLLNNPSVIEKGDVFLVRRSPMDWTHTGIVMRVDGKMVHTIEGNTNDEGSREGFEVCQRIRNLDRNIFDIFKTDVAGV